MTQNNFVKNPIEDFISKYKKWFIAGISLQLIPTIIFFGSVVIIAFCLFINNDTRGHPYKSDIVKGYEAGLRDGNKDRGSLLNSNFDYLNATPWNKYWKETDRLKKQVETERKEYLSKFPEEERGGKLAEMKLQNTKLPTEIILEGRFKRGLDFYADYVDKKVKKENYKNDEEYQKALKKEAWKAGYEYGYGKGWDLDKDLAGKL